MTRRAATLVSSLLATLTLATSALAQPSSDALWNSRGCLDDTRGSWFRDAKFGAIIHFGVYSTLGGSYEGEAYTPSEQIIGLGERRAMIPPADYRAKVAANFNPAKFDAAQWVSLMKKAGQKYVILTTKHHDGFCMWKTATTSFNVVDATPFKRDVVRELSDECRKQGLEFAVYYSIGDWCAQDVQNPGYASYRDYMLAQLRELLTNYGDLKLLWFDNWWYVNSQWTNDDAHAKDLYTFARSISPNILVNDRCGAGVKSTHGDYATPENQLKGSLQSRYFEVVMTNTDDEHWAWVRGARNYRSPSVLIRNLIDSTSKGGNFVLNVGPTDTGEFPPEHVAILEAMGRWTSTNAEALYATIPAPEAHTADIKDAVVYATQSKDTKNVYLHIVQWPAGDAPLTVTIDRGPLTRMALLDPAIDVTETSTDTTNASTTITIKRPKHPDPAATVFKLTFN
jgi:alpha-L-fucosidase